MKAPRKPSKAEINQRNWNIREAARLERNPRLQLARVDGRDWPLYDWTLVYPEMAARLEKEGKALNRNTHPGAAAVNPVAITSTISHQRRGLSV